MENLKILTQLKAVIQVDINKKFGTGVHDHRTLESVREHGQRLLDTFISELVKESPELKKQWGLGHPFKVVTRFSVETRSFEIEIVSKDSA